MAQTQKRRPGGGGAAPKFGDYRLPPSYPDTALLSIIAEIDRRMSVAWLAGLVVRNG